MREGYRRGDSSRALRYDEQRPSAQNKSLIVYFGSPYTIGTCARLPGLRLSTACVPPLLSEPPPLAQPSLSVVHTYPPTTTMEGLKTDESDKESPPPQKIDPAWYVQSTALPSLLSAE